MEEVLSNPIVIVFLSFIVVMVVVAGIAWAIMEKGGEYICQDKETQDSSTE